MKDLSTLLFRVENPKLQPHAGQVLVAEPFIGDEHFKHGVISVIDYLASEGTTGVVLNNRTEYMLDETSKQPDVLALKNSVILCLSS